MNIFSPRSCELTGLEFPVIPTRPGGAVVARQVQPCQELTTASSAEKFDFQIAIHECGHFVAASHYEIPACPELTPGGVSRLAPEMSNPSHAGVCHTELPYSRFQYSVICWSGILAECLLGVAPSWAPPFPPSSRNLKDWHLMVLNQADKLSRGDQLGIFGTCDTGDSKIFTQGGVWRSCKSAFRILRSNRGRITRLAKALTEAKAKGDRETDERKWAGVPRPSAFPATHADFLNLVCGNDSERFEQFVAHKAKSHLTNGRPENFENTKQILGASFDDAFAISMNLQRSIYAGDFSTADSWLAAARVFQTWTNDK
jgi:hypothetical protein